MPWSAGPPGVPSRCPNSRQCCGVRGARDAPHAVSDTMVGLFRWRKSWGTSESKASHTAGTMCSACGQTCRRTLATTSQPALLAARHTPPHSSLLPSCTPAGQRCFSGDEMWPWGVKRVLAAGRAVRKPHRHLGWRVGRTRSVSGMVRSPVWQEPREEVSGPPTPIRPAQH